MKKRKKVNLKTMSEEEEYTNRPYILSDSEEVTENGIQGPI